MSSKIFVRCVALGLGDLFLTRLLFDANNISDKLYIDFDNFKQYRKFTEHNNNFILYILDVLFKDKYIILKDDERIEKALYYYNQDYNFNKSHVDLKSYFNTKPLGNLDKKYIVFQTKSRLDCFPYYEYLIPKLDKFFSEFKTDYDIIIIGEKKLTDNLEIKYNNIKCLYEQIIKLKNNNNVIDLTQEELTETPNIDIFERDIRIVANAEKVFGFGWGGNFAMTWAVNSNFCFYIHELQHPIIWFLHEINNSSVVRKIDDFFENINTFKI